MSDEKGRATMFDGWDPKPEERARQLQGKVFELEAQNAGLVRALEAGIALATAFETAKDSDDELDVIHRLTAWGDQSAIEIKRAASRSLASPGDDGDDGEPDYAEAYRRWWNWASENKVAMQFVCLECGEGTKSDEDGCCASCGLTIVVAPAEGASTPGAPCPACGQPAPSPLQEAPGMKPGQRCTRRVKHTGKQHEFDPMDDNGWSYAINEDTRCPYVAGALQEAPTCGACGGSDSPPDFAGPAYKASWPCSECGRRRCCPDRCTRCAPPATEPCPCGEGGNPLHVFVHPAPKEPR